VWVNKGAIAVTNARGHIKENLKKCMFVPERLCSDGQPPALLSEMSLHSFTGILSICRSSTPPDSFAALGGMTLDAAAEC
jgi:hypothetical protein